MQTMPDVSPTKWHMAHVTWFFETFVLKPHAASYRPFHPAFEYLYNSYYNGVGEQYPRPRRGLMTRPTLDEIRDYRAHVDRHVLELLEQDRESRLTSLVELGSAARTATPGAAVDGHQARPVVQPAPAGVSRDARGLAHGRYRRGTGSITPVGWSRSATTVRASASTTSGRGTVYLAPFRIASRLVTNAEYREFIEDGGYTTPGVVAGRRLGHRAGARLDGSAVLGAGGGCVARVHARGTGASRSGGPRLPRQLLRGVRLCRVGLGPLAAGRGVGGRGRSACDLGQLPRIRSDCTPAPARRRRSGGAGTGLRRHLGVDPRARTAPYPGFRTARRE